MMINKIFQKLFQFSHQPIWSHHLFFFSLLHIILLTNMNLTSLFSVFIYCVFDLKMIKFDWQKRIKIIIPSLHYWNFQSYPAMEFLPTASSPPPQWISSSNRQQPGPHLLALPVTFRMAQWAIDCNCPYWVIVSGFAVVVLDLNLAKIWAILVHHLPQSCEDCLVGVPK